MEIPISQVFDSRREGGSIGFSKGVVFTESSWKWINSRRRLLNSICQRTLWLTGCYFQL